MLYRHYKLSLDDYEKMVEVQEGRCKICFKQPYIQGRLWLSVDHNHKCCPGEDSCGKCVRGLLCDTCNRALGMFYEDVEILNAAIEYLAASHFG